MDEIEDRVLQSDGFDRHLASLMRELENTTICAPDFGRLSFLNKQFKLNSARDADPVVFAIEKARNMKELELRGNTLGIEAGKRIAQALLRHPELERCLWSDLFTGRLKSEIPPVLISLTSAMMQANCRITELDLSDNAFGPIGAEGIQEFLVSPSAYSIEVLKLNNNGLGAGGKIIASCLLKCCENARRDGKQFKLKTFIAGRNRLENPGAQALAKAFTAIKTLEHISIPQNGIRPEGIMELADSLKENRNLKTIVFNDNTCTSEGASHIAKSLETLSQLETLDLGDSLCRSPGCVEIISAVCDGRHRNIKFVDLSGSEMPVEIAKEILKKWSRSFGSSDAKLKISHNMFGSSFDILAAKIVKKNLNVDLGSYSDDEGSPSERDTSSSSDREEDSDDERSDSDNGRLSFLDQQLKLDDANGAEPVALAIENLSYMKELELCGNTMGIEAGDRIAKALLRHRELERCIWSDVFTGRCVTEIPQILRSLTASIIRANCQIIELDLSHNALGLAGAEAIQDFLVSPSAYFLEILTLDNTGLGAAGGKLIANCLLKCWENARGDGLQFKLRTFNAGGNRLENSGAQVLAKAFATIRTLEHIRLQQNGILCEGIMYLADSFEANPNLKTIILNDNTCGTSGAYYIAKALPSLLRLKILDLGDCLCRSAGCAAVIAILCDGLHHNIEYVDLSGSEMPGTRAVEILKSWYQSFGSTDALLKIGNNMFGSLFPTVADAIKKKNLNVDLGSFSEDEGSLSE